MGEYTRQMQAPIVTCSLLFDPLFAPKKGLPSVASRGGLLPRAPLLLLPLLAGGGWEGVKLLILWPERDPTPTLPCEQGREHK